MGSAAGMKDEQERRRRCAGLDPDPGLGVELLPAGDPRRADRQAALGLAPSLFFGIFSIALLLSSGLAPLVGRVIDRQGGRPVLALSNVVLAGGLAMLGLARVRSGSAPPGLSSASARRWGSIARPSPTLTRLYGRGARAPITGITLIAGFASTIGWPASAPSCCSITAGARRALSGRRSTSFVCMPLNWLLIPPARPSRRCGKPRKPAPATRPSRQRGAMLVLAFFFAATALRQRRACGASAAPAGRRRRDRDRGDRRRGAGRPGAGRGAARRIRPAALDPPADRRRGSPRCCIRSAPALHGRCSGPPGIAFFAHPARRRQRHDDDRQGHPCRWRCSAPSGYGCAPASWRCRRASPQSAAPFVFGLLIDRVGTAAIAVSAGLVPRRLRLALCLALAGLRRAAPI